MPSEPNGVAAPLTSSKDRGEAINPHTNEPWPVSVNKEPLQLSGALDKFISFQSTPIVGQEFPDVKLVDGMTAPNSDELIRDLAITGLSLCTFC